MGDSILSLVNRFSSLAEIFTNLLEKQKFFSSSDSSDITARDKKYLDYYVRSFQPYEPIEEEEEESDENEPWISKNIKSYCVNITNNFGSNKILCPISTHLSKKQTPQTCIKKVNGKKPKVEYFDDWNFNQEDYYQLSADWMQLGRLDRAAQAACFAIGENNKVSRNYELLSLAFFFKLNRINVEEMAPNAIEVSQAEVYLDPENPNAYFRLASLLEKTADQLIFKKDTQTLKTRNGLYWEAINTFQTAIGFSSSSSSQEAAEFYYQAAQAWLKKAEVLKDLKSEPAEIDRAWENALIDFNASRLNNPREGKTYFHSAATLQMIEEVNEKNNNAKLSAEEKQAQWSLIAEYYKKAMKMDKTNFENPENILTLVTAFKKAGKYRNAHYCLKMFIKKDRHNPTLLAEMATLEEKMGYKKRARYNYHLAKENLKRDGGDKNSRIMKIVLAGLSRTNKPIQRM